VLHSALVESFTEEELLSIIGHELAHVKCHHTKWTAFMSQSPTAIPIISEMFNLLFLFWGRKAEHTCDRGGLLCTRNIKADISALAKLAIGERLFKQLDIEQFMTQKLDYDKELFPRLSELLGTHPNLLNRINELRRFHASNQYQILAGETEVGDDFSDGFIDNKPPIITNQQVTKAASNLWIIFLKLTDGIVLMFGLLAFSMSTGLVVVETLGGLSSDAGKVLLIAFFTNVIIMLVVSLIHSIIVQYLNSKGHRMIEANKWCPILERCVAILLVILLGTLAYIGFIK